MLDEFYMRLALNEAWKYQILTYPNPPVGAALLDRFDRLIAVAAHKKAGEPHAEVNAFFDGFCELCRDESKIAKLRALKTSEAICDFLRKNHDGLFSDTTLFVTLEPCARSGKTPACAPLIADLGVKKAVIGCDDPNPKMAGGGAYLLERGVTVVRGAREKECEALLEPFKIWLRRAFILFKWAQRLNGSINDGKISSDPALRETHAIRGVCDLLAIGGATVRADRPVLDARRANAKAPNVLIVSRRDDFDKTVPIFSVPDRSVSIAREINLDRGLVLVEGGGGLLNYLADRIDWLLCYESLALSGGNLSIAFDRDLELLRGDTIGDNIKLWLKIK
ncbi:MAG: bifunctional diaminohydroxyphosphoribosylaminopyrimidine deaminase/5-amino-6-(5-phosphoribosylamino)uracil reductase RibD [Helicobacteraceae bacterium]|nr:bifunctional diaminohydroxyphosphoribosylaminopyrimidine deaminase/5-amino-6-(5-phosphoribosylamino)uracil reductase RibD [Helicobacteraceae bacterium]